jgi:hypothetical protein
MRSYKMCSQGGSENVRTYSIENTFYIGTERVAFCYTILERPKLECDTQKKREWITWKKSESGIPNTKKKTRIPTNKTGKKILGLPPGASCVNKTKNVGLVRHEVRLCVTL